MLPSIARMSVAWLPRLQQTRVMTVDFNFPLTRTPDRLLRYSHTFNNLARNSNIDVAVKPAVQVKENKINRRENHLFYCSCTDVLQ
jgi:hypothetical protein